MEGKTKDSNSQLLPIGNLEEQTCFTETHRAFIERFSNLSNLVNTAFARGMEPPSTLVDKLIFSLGYSCAEDFGEILLLCGNGYGVGAQKILRGMYERAVTGGNLKLCGNASQAAYPLG